jgi:hypothetical protein
MSNTAARLHVVQPPEGFPKHEMTGCLVHLTQAGPRVLSRTFDGIDPATGGCGVCLSPCRALPIGKGLHQCVFDLPDGFDASTQELCAAFTPDSL